MRVLIELPNGIRSTIFIETSKKMTEQDILEWIKDNTKIIAHEKGGRESK